MSKKMLRRFRVLLIACLFIFLVLTARLAQLQILAHEHYLTRAEINRTRILTLSAPRGEILDRQGRVLAGNKPGFAVSVLDLDRKEAPRIIAELSRILDMEEEEIRRLIWEQRYRRWLPVRLKADVNQEVVAELTERRTELPGVILQVQPIRVYPENNLAAHILGRTGLIQPGQLKRWQEQGLQYTANDIVGRHGGIEEIWEPYLKGQDGSVRVEVNNLSQTTRIEYRIDPVPGNNTYLTLDADIQRDLELAMRKTMTALNAKDKKIGLKGAAVALDPRSGAILAMVSLPDFDLNTFTIRSVLNELQSDPNRPLLNRAIAGAYPVGSTYKVVTALAGLEEKVVTPTSRIHSPGFISVPGARDGTTKSNYNRNVGHGSITVGRALQISSNTFFYQVGYRIGSERMREWGLKFGLGGTGLKDLMNERRGVISDRRGAAAVMDAAIGQQHAITPLGLANMIAMAANGGIHYRPYLVDRVVDVAGQVIFQAEPEVLYDMQASSRNIRALQEGLESVMAAGGTAARFRNFPYPVKFAGKTGTAEVRKEVPPHSVCVTYAPAGSPEIALAVLIDSTGISSVAAVPITWDFYVSYFARQFEAAREEGKEAEEKEGGA